MAQFQSGEEISPFGPDLSSDINPEALDPNVVYTSVELQNNSISYMGLGFVDG